MQKTSSKRYVYQRFNVRSIVMLAMLTALGVVLSMPFMTLRLSFGTKISFVFIVIALAARKYGVLGGVIVAALTDILQALLSGLGLNLLITLSAAAGGLIYGLLLHKNVTLPRVILAVLLKALICSMGLTTAALVVFYSQPLYATLFARLLQTAIMSVIEFLVIYFVMVNSDLLQKIRFLD